LCFKQAFTHITQEADSTWQTYSLLSANMSRMSARTYLVTAKRHLQQALKDKSTASFVIGNESADLDSITSALVYGYLQSSKAQSRREIAITIPVTNIPASDLPLRPELTALLHHAGIKPSDLITLDDLGKLPLPLSKTSWTLVDHNVLTGAIGEHYSDATNAVLDHHDDEGTVPSSATPRIIEKSGSCNSLVVNHLRSAWDDISSSSFSIGAANAQSSDGVVDDASYTSGWDAQVAKLALGSILIDTYNLTDESKVTEHDLKAVRYLEAKINASPKYGKDYDRDAFFKEINDAKSNLDDLSLDDILRKDYKQWTEGDMLLGISTAVQPLKYLTSKAETEKNFTESLTHFAKSRKLDLFAVMTAYTSDSGAFSRQLLLIAANDTKAADRFSKQSTQELKLVDGTDLPLVDTPDVPWIKVWQQGNVGASRKRVGPLLRDAMR
jgi:exopolyphosphatase